MNYFRVALNMDFVIAWAAQAATWSVWLRLIEESIFDPYSPFVDSASCFINDSSYEIIRRLDRHPTLDINKTS